MIFLNEKLDLEIYHEYSQHSKKYNKKNNYSILKNIISKSGLTIATLYYWLKIDNPSEFKNLMSENTAFFDDRIINNKDLAELYYNMNPNQYVYSKDFGWYAYNNNNVLKHFKKEAPPSLLYDISNRLHEWIDTLKNSISLSDEKSFIKFKTLKTAYKTVGSSSFIKGIIDYLKNMYYVDDLNNKIDNNIKIF